MAVCVSASAVLHCMLRALIPGAIVPHFIRVLAYRAFRSKPLQAAPSVACNCPHTRECELRITKPPPKRRKKRQIEREVKTKRGKIISDLNYFRSNSLRVRVAENL